MASFKTLLRKGVQVSGGDRVALGTLVLEVGGARGNRQRGQRGAPASGAER